ncbi:phosphotransferase family protein [Mycobacterium syngnathidarum]
MREYLVAQALQSTRVPTAATVALDADGSYLGAQVGIVAFVPGTAVRSQDDLADLSDRKVGTVTDALVQCLMDLHDVDPAQVGLEAFGRPDGFVARQVALWARQWDRVKEHHLRDVDRLSRRLTDRIPTDNASAAIIHGDFRIDNTLLDISSSDPVRAVVDWEMSTIGDPLTDLALMCVYRTTDFDAILGFPARRGPVHA